MKKLTLVILALTLSIPIFAGGGISHNDGKAEVTYIKNNKRVPDVTYQATLRDGAAWQNFLQQHGTWYVIFNEENAKPHRAFGKPIATIGTDAEQKALNFINSHLQDFNIPVNELHLAGVSSNEKQQFVNFYQEYQGLRVLQSRMTVKLSNNSEVIMFGADVFTDIDVNTTPTVSAAAAVANASQGIPGTITNTTAQPGLKVLPVPYFKNNTYHLVYEINVEAMEGAVPSNYYTLVDAHSGEVMYRSNTVMHHNNKHKHAEHPGGTIDVYAEGSIYATHPFDPVSTDMLPNMEVSINGTTYHTDLTGNLITPENGPQGATFFLRGHWSTIRRNNNTPSFSNTLLGGNNTVSFNSNSTIEERSAFYHVNIIHDQCKAVLPSFTGMDFSLTTNVDVTGGDCNAFYNGSSINFYAAGNGCNSLANVADVVYHEYGHGINDNYYQSFGQWFQNGAMNEGYADVWGYSVTENPLLGVGFDDTDPTVTIRRYDIDRKVYPVDIVGEVHADGEIIAGAWWDTYLNLNNDMALTMDLFAGAYPGLQATVSNGNEGQAFTDVLIDVLQYDDNNADITDGTPNGVEIVNAFALHGITLLSNADLVHNDIEQHVDAQPIIIDANMILTFPWTTYLDDVKVYYRLNGNPAWTSSPMPNIGGNDYQGTIPAQPAGTLISYYVGAEDLFGQVSAVRPIGAAEPDPNIPYFILVQFDLELTDDVGDFSSELGSWDIGLPSDNATTGMWEVNIPLGSYGTPGDASTIVAPNDQVTVGGDLCFVTQNAITINDPLGQNDVDGGTTTLRSDVIDLTGYTNPTFTYYRWYINNPPSGANPGADWWQVQISDDGGNTWTKVEDTKVSDRSWRRYAFRVMDYVNITNQVMLKFNVSDSTRPGQYLDGGSLVEAGLDEIMVWDKGIPTSVMEEEGNHVHFGVYPNPASDVLNATFELEQSVNVTVEVYNTIGELVVLAPKGVLATGQHQLQLTTGDLTPGIYMVNLLVGEQRYVERVTVVK